MDNPPKPHKRCSQCPFARATPKTYLDTMGDNSERFPGQAIGPFPLPCHMTKQFGHWREDPTNQTPCVGAAEYRTNCGYTHLAGKLPMLPANTEEVFASPVELIAHHRAISLEEAAEFIARKPVLAMLREEMSRSGVQFVATLKKEDA
jgi:hypothetical protein